MITELKPTNLFSVKVPVDTYDYSYDSYRNWISANVDGKYHNTVDWFSYKLPEGKYKILGEVTKDRIEFDVKSYLWHELKSVGYVWMDYNLYDHEATGNGREVVYKDKRPHKFDEPEDSFYSLLEANGLTSFEKLLIIEKNKNKCLN